MPAIGVNTAIIQNDKILLTQRVDFEVWCLPGGSVDENETMAQAAVREAFEETGLEVRLTRLIGLYFRPGWISHGLHVAVFAAEVVGGVLHPQASEVLDIRFFGRDELPAAMLLGHDQRCLDAFNGVTGAVWFQDAEWPFAPGTTRQQVYDQCAQSGLPKPEFYRCYVGKPGPRGAIHEIK